MTALGCVLSGDGDIVRGLGLRRPELDRRRVQDVGLGEADDRAILAWAAENGRIVLTHDRATMPAFASERRPLARPTELGRKRPWQSS